MDDQDLDREVRGLYREPPYDPDATERARIRLEAEYKSTEIPNLKTAQRSTRLPVAAAMAACVAILLVAVVIWPRPSASAKALDGLQQVSSVHPPPTDADFPASTTEALYPKGYTDARTGRTFTILVRARIDTKSLGDGSFRSEQTVRDASFLSEGDRQTWVDAGRPPILQPGDRLSDTASAAADFDPTAVSTDPDQLLAALRSGEVAPWSTGDDQTFLLIGDLLAQPGLSTAQRSALYHAAASLNGVELLGDQVDPLGRPGVGISVATDDRESVIIFDADTGQPLATEIFTNDQLNEWFAFDSRG
jgi:hypothetical protein